MNHQNADPPSIRERANRAYGQPRIFGAGYDPHDGTFYTVRADAPHSASSYCTEATLSTLPIAVQSATYKALPALEAGSAPLIIEVQKHAIDPSRERHGGWDYSESEAYDNDQP